MRAAVVGHVEWVEFLRVAEVPEAGAIADVSDTWQEPGGSGAVAAMQLARLAGGASLYTALGDDELGHRAHDVLTARGVTVHAAWRPAAQRRAVTLTDDSHERTIFVIGERLAPEGADALPWAELADAGAVYFTAGDAAALRAARAAGSLVATPRALGVLADSGVQLDALVGSGSDPGEQVEPGTLDPVPRLTVTTHGSRGGEWHGADGSSGRWDAAALPGPPVDAYGCGDTFAAGVTFGLGDGMGIDGAVQLGARCGAEALTGRGVHVLSGELPALDAVERALRDGWALDTSDDPDKWTEDNPALGQCAVSALVIRAIYGGQLVIATVLDRDGNRTPDGHAWNILPSGEHVDFAFEQFRDGEQLAEPIVTEPVIHGDPHRAHRLAGRVARRLGHPIELPPV